jgi:hypothetical protein
MSRRTLTLTNDERFLLDHYINIYNEQQKNIDLMYVELKETREIIDYITRVDERIGRNTSTNTSTNTPTNTSTNTSTNTPTNTSTNTSTNTPTNTSTNTNTGTDNFRTTGVYRWDYYIPIDDLVDVVVSPTQEEIANNTIQIRYNEVINPLNSSCPFTLERFENNTECTQIIGCGHLFNRDGLNRWLIGNVRCPICRYDIRNRSEPEMNENTGSDNLFNAASDISFNTLLNSFFRINGVSRRRSRTYDNNTSPVVLADISFNSIDRTRNNR